MLKEIIIHKRQELAALDRPAETARFRREIPGMPPIVSLKSSLKSDPHVSIIAEIKRRSPSRGRLRQHVDVARLADRYERAGARAISVLTDTYYFDGSVRDLKEVRRRTHLPILRKDFIIDEFQVYESRAIGADAILLIIAALSPDEFRHLYTLAHDVGLEVLTEIHNERELDRALNEGAGTIGVNNRDLNTFEVNVTTTERLRPLIPRNILCVAESGLHTRADMARMELAGVDAVLIGESLMLAEDPAWKIRELIGNRHDAD